MKVPSKDEPVEKILLKMKEELREKDKQTADIVRAMKRVESFRAASYHDDGRFIREQITQIKDILT